MSFTDTPDWMSGVYTPQQLLDTFAGAPTSQVVTLPPNTESLLIIAPNNFTATLVGVVGVTTGQDYPPLPYGRFIIHDQSPIYVVPVSPVADQQVTVTWASAPGVWYAVADAGVRTVLDPNLALALQSSGTAYNGEGFVMEGVISSTTAIALSAEATGALKVSVVGANLKQHGVVANGSGIVSAPSAGLANRLYKCIVSVAIVPECVNLIGVTSGTVYGSAVLGTANYGVSMEFAQPIDCTEALSISDTTNNQNITYNLHTRLVTQ